VLGAETRHALEVELDPVAGAELLGFEAAAVQHLAELAEEVLEPSR
jgi:hypothetical protein